MAQHRRRRQRMPVRKLAKRWWPRVVWRLPLLLLPVALGSLMVAAYVYVQFSQMILQGFEGKRWSLASKVYAEPESLYPGLPLRLNDMQASLERLGYRSVQTLTHEGQYRVRATQMDIALRQFQYAHRHEIAQRHAAPHRKARGAERELRADRRDDLFLEAAAGGGVADDADVVAGLGLGIDEIDDVTKDATDRGTHDVDDLQPIRPLHDEFPAGVS